MEKKHTSNQLLLLEDVTNLGRKGELVRAKPGFIRNFLLPQKKAVVADKRTIRMQERLREERAKQALADKKDAEALAIRLQDVTLETTVKSDTQGHLYGSVSQSDIAKLLIAAGFEVDKRYILIVKPIKTVGVYDIQLRLKEDVPASFKLQVKGDKATVTTLSQAETTDNSQESLTDDEQREELPDEAAIKEEMQEELDERTKE